MFIAEASRITTASEDKIWGLWSDVDNWKTWDPDVVSSTMGGKFEKGAKGTLQPSSGPSVNLEITDYAEKTCFVSKSYLPIASIVFEHKMHRSEEGLKVTHRITFEGWSVFTYPLSYFLGDTFRKGLPIALNNMIKKAEEK